ncbi:MAG: hypothetical protein WBM10_06080 [Limnochordia bacterium]
MIRKLMVVSVAVCVLLSFSTLAWAQDYWNYNVFPYNYERFVYEVTTYGTAWDWDIGEEVVVETKMQQFLEIRKLDEENAEVTQGQTQVYSYEDLGEAISFMGGLGGLAMLSGGPWFGELMFLGMWAADLELEVGNNMQLFDGSRVRVVDEQTVAGVRGYLVRKFVRETDEEGNRQDITTSEWVIAPNVGWPLSLTMYEDGEVSYEMVLVEYERK